MVDGPAAVTEGVSPARIGLLPMSSDRQKQMSVVEQSLKHFRNANCREGGRPARSAMGGCESAKNQ